MVLSIKNKILDSIKITKRELILDLAIGLFTDYKTSLGQSARIAGLSQGQFTAELCKRKIPLHYDLEELEQDSILVNQL